MHKCLLKFSMNERWHANKWGSDVLSNKWHGARVASRKILNWSHTSPQDKFQRDQTKHFKIENETIHMLGESLDFFFQITQQ